MRDSISEDLPNPNNLKEQMKNANENNALNPFLSAYLPQISFSLQVRKMRSDKSGRFYSYSAK